MKPLKVLIVEDSEQDAALLLRELQKAGYSPVHRRVETAQEMTDAFDSQDWDIVLSDYVMPGFGGLAALGLLRNKGLDLPFIVVSGQIGEDVAVGAMKAGAHDYIMKGNLKRLGPAITRELSEAGNRRQRRKAEDELEKYHANLEQMVRQRTAELRESEGRFRSLSDNSPDVISRLNTQLRHLYMNPAGQKMAGLPLASFIGNTFEDLDIPAEVAVPLKEKMGEVLRTGKPATFEHGYSGPQGTRYYQTVSTPEFADDGSVKSLLNVSRDITEIKRVEQIKDEFIGMVSHELKTPLTVIMGALHTATAKGVSEKEARELLQDAIDGANNLAGIIENLLELSRSQANRLLLHAERADVGRIARDVVRKLQTKSAIHRLNVDLPEEVPAAMVDTVRVERILFNLIENAIKYSPKGGEVRVSAHREDDSLIVCVSDQGIGISREDQSRLFQSFQRLEAKKDYAIAGVGLGLRVCRILVEAHSGRIWVESEPGKGSAFYFTLPVNRKTA